MTKIDSHANALADSGRVDANYRKHTRQLELRNWLLQGRPSDSFMLTRQGSASASGLSLYVMDPAEPDRPSVVMVRSREDAYAVIELAARFINERDKAEDTARVANGERPFFNYKGGEVDRILSAEGADEYYAVQFDNRSDDFHSYPTTTKWMNLTGRAMSVMRAVMSRQD